jgi:hypothetical protein
MEYTIHTVCNSSTLCKKNANVGHFILIGVILYKKKLYKFRNCVNKVVIIICV